LSADATSAEGLWLYAKQWGPEAPELILRTHYLNPHPVGLYANQEELCDFFSAC
jgi:hypothetical protein